MWIRITLIAILASTPLLALTATEVLQKSEELYKRAGNFSAKFTQVVSAGDFFDDERTKGILLMQYPDKFKLETPEQVITSDGDSLWSYSVDNNQVTIDPVSRIEGLVTPADYLFEFRKNYNVVNDSVALTDSAGVFRLPLTAKRDDQYVRALQLFVDSKGFAVIQVIYDDINGNRITIRFHDLNTDLKIDPGSFRFKTPKGVEEVRLP